MKLKAQKTIAGKVMKCSPYRVVFATEHLSDIKEAITRQDIKTLINQGIIRKRQEKGTSRVRARHIQTQKRKGRQRGQGSRKGKKTARAPKKETWMNRIRVQRKFLKRLVEKEKVSTKDYRILYNKAKGGFFRSKRHIQLYVQEHKILKNEQTTKN